MSSGLGPRHQDDGTPGTRVPVAISHIGRSCGHRSVLRHPPAARLRRTHALPARKRLRAWIPANRGSNFRVTAGVNASLARGTIALSVGARRAIHAEVIVVAETAGVAPNALRAAASKGRLAPTVRLSKAEVPGTLRARDYR